MPYLGWDVISMPTTPASPASLELGVRSFISGNISPFTGQMQTYDWNANYMEASAVLPPMTYATAQNWVAFLRSLKGIGSVFQFSAAFMAAYPNDIGTRYWRMKQNFVKWSIGSDRLYRMSFDAREAT